MLGFYGTTKPPSGATIEWGHPLAVPGMYRWLFNEGSGSQISDIAQGAKGVCAGSPTWTATGTGTALRFNGTDQYVEGPALISVPLSDFTVHLEARPGTLALDMAALTFYGTDDFVIYPNDTNDGNGLRVFWRDRGGTVINENSGVNSIGKDIRICVVRRGNTLSVYRNGALVQSATLGAGTEGPFTGLRFGCFELTQWYAGAISDVAIFPRALLPFEVAWLAAEPYAMIAAPSRRRRYFYAEEGAALTLDLADTLTLSDAVAKSPRKVLADAFSLSDAIVKRTGKSLADAFVLADGIAKSPRKPLADGFALSDGIAKGVRKPLADGFTLSDGVSKSTRKPLADGFTLTDTVTKQVGKNLSDGFNLTDGFSRVVAYVRSFADAFTLSDAVAKRVGKALADVFTLSESIAMVVGEVITTIFRRTLFRRSGTRGTQK